MNKRHGVAVIDKAEVWSLSDAEIDVLAERRRQQDDEGWTLEHDDEHTDESLSLVAVCYLMYVKGKDPVGAWAPPEWPNSWDKKWWKPKSYRENLIRAGALIVAEIERLDRQSLTRPSVSVR